MSGPGSPTLRSPLEEPVAAPRSAALRHLGRPRSAPRVPLATALTWSVVALGSLISAEGAVPLSPSDRVLLSASSAPLVAVLALAASLLLGGWVRPVVPAMVGPWIAFVSLAALSTAWSVSTSRSVEAVLVLTSVAVVFLLLNLVQTPPAMLDALRRGVVLSGAAGALWGLVNFVAGTLPVGGGGTPRFTAIDAPNATAAAMLLPLVLALDAALSRAGLFRIGPARTVGRRLEAGLAALIAVGILITGSRGGLVAACAGTVVLVVSRGARIRPAALLLSATVIGAAFLAAPPALQDHLTATHSTGRTGLWTLGAEACAEHCLTGSGFGSFPAVYTEVFQTSPAASGYHDADFKAHNIWLEAAVETGVIGIAVLLTAVGLTARHAWRAPAERRPSALAALVAVLAATLFLSHLSLRYFWLVLIYVALAGTTARTPAAEDAP